MTWIGPRRQTDPPPCRGTSVRAACKSSGASSGRVSRCVSQLISLDQNLSVTDGLDFEAVPNERFASESLGDELREFGPIGRPKGSDTMGRVVASPWCSVGRSRCRVKVVAQEYRWKEAYPISQVRLTSPMYRGNTSNQTHSVPYLT